MKYLLHRTAALLLAILLLCSAGGPLALAVQDSLPDPDCVLGTTASDMLAGGGRRVQTPEGDFYLRDEDAAICLRGQTAPVVEGPAAKLNYLKGVLYYARVTEERFDLCAYDLGAEEETLLLEGFSGTLGQLYAVDGAYLDFSCGNAIWQLELDSGDYRLIRFADSLRSFVPTGCGLLYATGELFDYTLYAEDTVVADHVESYYVDPARVGGALVYSRGGEDWQQDLASAFGGVIAPMAFSGYAYVSLSSDLGAEPSEEEAQAELDAESERLADESAELTEEQEPFPAPPDPAEADPNDPQLPPELIPTEPEEPTVEEPAAEEPTTEEPTAEEPAVEEPTTEEPVVEEPAAEEPTVEEPTVEEPKDEPIEAEPFRPEAGEAEPPAETGTGSAQTPVWVEEPPLVTTALFSAEALRRPVSAGQENIVRRARQMLNIQWTPKLSFGGWGYYDSSYNVRIWYQAGTTYRGIPYGMGMNYVPWSTTLTDFISAVNTPSSKLYTERSTVSRGAQYYGTDCSGFVSWAWDLSKRTLNNNTGGMAHASLSTRVGKDYTQIEIGDALIREDSSWSHSRLVTDVTYEADGVTIKTVEVSEANPTSAHNGCCYSTVYSGSNLQKLTEGSYAIYRSNSRNSAGYTHECVVPLEGDYCPICGVGTGDQDVDPKDYLLPGVDVSYAQGTISWQTAAPYVGFAIIRAGYTGYVNPVIGKDSQLEANLAGCEANGVPYGIYFYAGATSEAQAIREAEAVIEYLGLMSGSGHIPALPIFYDVEENNNILALDNAKLLSVITAFCSTIENFGLRAGVYASTDVWNNRLTDSAYSQWARWVAQWGSSTMTARGGAHVWQYDNAGRIPGIAANVDLNVWVGEVGDLEHPSSIRRTLPGCTAEGGVNATCLLCGESWSVPIAPLGHAYLDGVCTRCGAKQAEPFRDVPEGKWYYNAVNWAVERGITAGTAEGLFSPNQECTRGQIITFLWRAAGSPAVADTGLPFTDVPSGKYYYQAVLWAVKNGIVSGLTETTFGPNKSCTRAQAMVFLWRYAGSPAPTRTDLPFTDVDRTAYYRDAVLWAVENGVTSGTSAGKFSPNKSCTRAEIVTFLYAAQNDQR